MSAIPLAATIAFAEWLCRHAKTENRTLNSFPCAKNSKTEQARKQKVKPHLVFPGWQHMMLSKLFPLCTRAAGAHTQWEETGRLWQGWASLPWKHCPKMTCWGLNICKSSKADGMEADNTCQLNSSHLQRLGGSEACAHPDLAAPQHPLHSGSPPMPGDPSVSSEGDSKP